MVLNEYIKSEGDGKVAGISMHPITSGPAVLTSVVGSHISPGMTYVSKKGRAANRKRNCPSARRDHPQGQNVSEKKLEDGKVRVLQTI